MALLFFSFLLIWRICTANSPFVDRLGLFISALIMMETIKATYNLGNLMC